MKTIFEHVEHIKGKPHHVRKQVAFGVAAFGSALVALVWFSVSMATGAFAIQGSDFAASMEQGGIATTSAEANQGLAGAAAAMQNDDAPAHIEIVDTSVAAPAKNQSEQTTLPF